MSESFDFVATADLHITDQRPKNRKDNYFETILNKFEQILEITKEKTHTNLLVVAGDFFDSPTVPYKVTKEIITIIKRHNVEILAVPGQHDQRYHQSGLNNTPFGVLVASGLIKTKSEDFPEIQGIGWNEKPTHESKILFIHTMVTEKLALFPGQENYVNAQELLEMYPFAELIISGDNHKPHLVKYKNRVQLNCGSIIRKSKDQIDYEPAVWGVKIEPKIKIEKIPLKIKPPQEVFDFDRIEKDEIQDEIKNEAQEFINKFIETLEDEETINLNFSNIIQKVVEETKPNDRVKQTIYNIMEKIAK
jgi:DNA repair exonuclease SbcCD nuclease subunit